MNRYHKYNHIIQNYQLSKFNIYNKEKILNINELEINAGHFKPNNLCVEHGLLLSNITSLTPQTVLFKHGKRLKNTVLLKTKTASFYKWQILDNFINLFVPLIGDLKQPFIKRSKYESYKYSWRIRNFFEWEDSNILLSERVLKKNIFLPLFFNITLNNKYNLKKYNYIAEQVLRMFRIPIKLYKKFK